MKNGRNLTVLGAFSAALAACAGDVRSPSGAIHAAGAGTGGGTAATGAGGAPTTGGSPAGGMTSGGATGGSGSTGVSTCVPGVPATSQIPRLLRRQYDAVLRDLLQVTAVDGKLPSAGLYADFDGPVNVDAVRLYREVAEKVAAQVMAGAGRKNFITCDPADSACLTETIKTFGRKAFRRPLTDGEVKRFEKLGQTTPQGTAEEVAEATLMAFLASPSFLQITELTEVQDAGTIKLSSYEVAARLSFLLWGSIPDELLSTAADQGELSTKEQILAQAERMIGVREKTAPLVAAAHRAYLDMENDDSHWWKVSHDTTKYPLYTAAAVPAEQAELDRVVEELTFTGGSFKDLFLTNVGFVNRDTAAIYGLDPASFGADLTRVELDPLQRPGILTRAGFLSSFSHFDGTSPILRGAYITVNIIGMNPGAPDPKFFLTPPPPGPFATERAYVEALTSQAACQGCHAPYVNPPGFVLENYDSIGKWQTVDPRSASDPTAGAIDPTATVTFSEGNAKAIASSLELMQEISKTPKALRLYVEKWVTFATGRLSDPHDACTVELIDTKLSENGYTILNLLADLTQADSFRLRVRGN
jgi:hypothetical protein